MLPMRYHSLLFCLLFFSFAQVLSAQSPALTRLGMEVTQENAPRGLTVGTKAPNFSGLDQYGQAVDLATLTQKSGVVLLFYRGDWCPVCNRHLRQLQDSLQLITDTGVQVIAVTPETNNNVRQTIQKTDARFRILSDQDMSIMSAYDVLFKATQEYQQRIEHGLGTNIAENNGADEAYLPVPATYIIGQDGFITYRHFDPNYKVRASVREILKRIEN